jgi:hypothetical protein
MTQRLSRGRRLAPRSASCGSNGLRCALLVLALVPSLVWAQTAPLAPANPPSPAQVPPQAQPAPAPEPAPPPPRKEGFIGALERWWDKSAADFKSSLDESRETWRKLNERNEKAAKDAADALSRLSNAKIVDGRERCETAPNGSPDCQAAAEKICKAKGFAQGNSADIQTSRKCSARAWLSGSPPDSACTYETVVVKAACQ